MDAQIKRAHGCAGAVDGVGTDVDGEGLGQLAQALCDPGLAVFVVLAGEGIFATEEGAADTAGYRMVIGRGFRADELVSGTGHGTPP